MLENENIKLRAIEPKDYEKIREWRTSSESYSYFFEYVPISEQQNIEFHQNCYKRKNEFNFCIVDKQTHLMIGTISVLNIDYRNSRAELGRVCLGDKDFHNKGYMTQTINLIQEYVFNHLNIHKLYCEVLKNNQKAINLYLKCGFQEEAVFKEHIFKNGKYEDVAILTIYGKRG